MSNDNMLIQVYERMGGMEQRLITVQKDVGEIKICLFNEQDGLVKRIREIELKDGILAENKKHAEEKRIRFIDRKTAVYLTIYSTIFPLVWGVILYYFTESK